MRTKVTLKELALKAGLATSTASMALRNSPELSRSTCLRVQELAKELDYTPNAAATKLATGKSGMIGLMYTRHGSAFNARILEALDAWSYQDGRYFNSLMTYSTRNRAEVLERFMHQILQGRLVDGLILASQVPSSTYIREYQARRLPLVLLENFSDKAHSVYLDNVAGVQAAVKYLVESGRRKIALVCGRLTPLPGVDPSRVSKDRFQAYRQAMESFGLPTPAKSIVEITYHEPQEGREALDQLMSRYPEMDAIFCSAGDNVAAGIHAQAQQRGLRMPDDIALVGFDDQPIAELLHPALTTVRQPFHLMAGKAWEILLAAIDQPDMELRSEMIAPELVIRQTA